MSAVRTGSPIMRSRSAAGRSAAAAAETNKGREKKENVELDEDSEKTTGDEFTDDGEDEVAPESSESNGEQFKKEAKVFYLAKSSPKTEDLSSPDADADADADVKAAGTIPHLKRKQVQPSEGNAGAASSPPLKKVKKPRLVWTPELHGRFVDAVNHLGVENSVPKIIVQLMNVEGLSRQNVASHLQKYRIYLKKNGGELPEDMPLEASASFQKVLPVCLTDQHNIGPPPPVLDPKEMMVPMYQKSAMGLSSAAPSSFVASPYHQPPSQDHHHQSPNLGMPPQPRARPMPMPMPMPPPYGLNHPHPSHHMMMPGYHPHQMALYQPFSPATTLSPYPYQYQYHQLPPQPQPHLPHQYAMGNHTMAQRPAMHQESIPAVGPSQEYYLNQQEEKPRDQPQQR